MPTLEQQLKTKKGQLSEKEAELTRLKDRIRGIKSSRVPGWAHDVATLEVSSSDLRTKISALKQDVRGLEKQLADQG